MYPTEFLNHYGILYRWKKCWLVFPQILRNSIAPMEFPSFLNLRSEAHRKTDSTDSPLLDCLRTAALSLCAHWRVFRESKSRFDWELIHDANLTSQTRVQSFLKQQQTQSDCFHASTHEETFIFVALRLLQYWDKEPCHYTR